MLTLNESEALAIEIAESYLSTRVLPDGSVAALGELITTRAIYLGCTREGYERRFCFADRALAIKQFVALQSEDDEPAGYVARRGG